MAEETKQQQQRRLLDLAGEAKLRVSSVLNGDGKQFGKKFLLDDREDTCWNSDQGSPQFVELKLDAPAQVTQLAIMFQGGFAGKNCVLEGKVDGSNEYTELGRFYPDDVNHEQVFEGVNQENKKVHMLRLVFPESTDFFGRITIYTLKIYVAAEKKKEEEDQ
ncbi:nuclear receptor 2C2-associated protein isoform 2 [Salpingoeca rosetta]|uniref:Nuclear receptor 2C2-associated protein isoform 2 n=1 Tax=Salpingoeca rosetta (strain ATCC 50818 / BSB-021) TaxID=946362 RepID=F2TWV7_SALR5|nr:nuclear receptor 2C2-associated protein isoform 2 [Salpingoeca rosetta]EGD72553.1 nuclear receptor 2C2-associated protein isoform 2 [Salpingoeca rosetta]|eukprot:XP_004999122.1 nuclear receptor 2C2-associated protein isoform 2 [Salpingoeca rosetta]